MTRNNFSKILLFLLALLLLSTNVGAQSFLAGETITYDIKKLGVKFGEASLRYEGKSVIDDKKAILIVFKAEGIKFYDEEKIYLDSVTMFPMTVVRDLDIMGNKEKITEVYDQASGAVYITKEANGKISKTTLKKEGQIDNIYAFLYRYRKSGTFKRNEELNLKLPTADVVIYNDKRTTLKAAGQNFDSFYFKSRPAKYQLWFAATPERLPLRIDGALGAVKASMVMKAFEP